VYRKFINMLNLPLEARLLICFRWAVKCLIALKLFDEEIESIRTFDPEKQQRSLEKIDRIQLYPAREFRFTDEAIKHFRRHSEPVFRKLRPKTRCIWMSVKALLQAGIEYYLPPICRANGDIV